MANPAPRRYRRRYNRRHRSNGRRRNPGFGGLGGEIVDTLWMIGGAVGSKMITQMILGSSNTGVMGYVGNVGSGLALSFVFSKFMHNASAAKAIFKGAVLQTILRVINDLTPLGAYTSSIGVGDYQASNWVTPQIYVDPNNSAMVKIPAGWGGGALPAGSAGGSKAAAGGGMGAAPFVGNYDTSVGNY